MKKVLFYSDAQHLGGHELQTINALKFLKDKFDITFIVYTGNTNFIELLKELNIKLIMINYYSNRFQILRTLFSFKHIYNLINIIKKIKPVIILNIQGNIELGSTMLLASRIAKVKSITYIPICHLLSEVTSNGWIAKVKDFINVFYYKLPDTFITLNDFNRKLIQKRGVVKPISIVFNGIEFNKYKIFDKNESKQKLNLIENKIYIALVGRIQFWHKGHDILLEMVVKYSKKLTNYKFILVGTGEDEEKMKSLIKEKGLEDYFLFLGHQKDLSLIYSAIDGVVIPSRFESGAGTPMVLLESIYYYLPIVMTDLPDMNLYLDVDQLFEKENTDDFYNKLKENTKLEIDKEGKNKIISMHSIEQFQINFFDVIAKEC